MSSNYSDLTVTCLARLKYQSDTPRFMHGYNKAVNRNEGREKEFLQTDPLPANDP